MLAAVQLPDGAALGRTQKSLEQVEQIANEYPASSVSSPLPAYRLSTTVLRSPMPVLPTSCSRTGA